MKRRIVMCTLLAAVMAFTVTGCGSGGDSGKTEITLTTTAELSSVEKAFEEAYPDVDLQVETMRTGEINGETGRRLRNDHGADIFTTSTPAGEMAEYAYDISSEAFVENYQADITKSLAIDGQNKYLPLPGSYYGYIINKTLLDELGLDTPQTKDDLLEILEKAKTEKTGVTKDTGYGFGLADIGTTFIGAYFTADFSTDFLSTADGARWLADFENGNAKFTGTWETSADFLKTCVEKGYMDPEKLITRSSDSEDDLTATAFKPEKNMTDRTAIMTFGNIATLNEISELSEDEFIMVPCLPESDKGNKMLSAISNNYIAINNALGEDEQRLKAAKSFLEFISTEEGQKAWMEDADCPYTYLNDCEADTDKTPENISEYIEKGMVYTNPFRTNLLSCIGKELLPVAKEGAEISEALANIDDYYINGSDDDIQYDTSVVGTVAADMIYENENTRYEETQLGNLISDSIREMTDADVALVNGGGIRSSLYKGDVTGSDIAAVCPYDNLIIVAEMDGKTLKAAVNNGIQKTWDSAGQFLQVSGIKYSYKPAANESEKAELKKITYADGKKIKNGDKITVAYTNYMGGSSGYVDAGDGFTMLNVYDKSEPVGVKLVEETDKTYCDALEAYFAKHVDEKITSEIEGRIKIIK